MRKIIAAALGLGVLLSVAPAPAASAGAARALSCADLVGRRVDLDQAPRLDPAAARPAGSLACAVEVDSDGVVQAAAARGPLDPIILFIDTAICPLIIIIFPASGDIVGIWDCPPYDSDDECTHS